MQGPNESSPCTQTKDKQNSCFLEHVVVLNMSINHGSLLQSTFLQTKESLLTHEDKSIRVFLCIVRLSALRLIIFAECLKLNRHLKICEESGYQKNMELEGHR